jgi:serine/threonine-protein kinase RsbW
VSGDNESALVRLALDLPEGPKYVASLRKTARCLLESVGVGRADLDDVELLLGELATNAVLHATDGADSRGYRVEVELRGRLVRLTVSDRGPGFPAEALPPPGTARADPAAPGAEPRFGGWGLPLVYSIADRVEIRPNLPRGAVVRADKRLSGCCASSPSASSVVLPR